MASGARLRQEHPAVSERPFDSAWKFARVTVQEHGRLVSDLKGAPEMLLGCCTLSTEDRESWAEKADAYAREGFRVLAVAWAQGDTEEHLSLLSLVLFWDPPRPEVPAAVATAQAAGIRVIMHYRRSSGDGTGGRSLDRHPRRTRAHR
jgi:Ca2+-transporting ATPase